MGNTPSLTLTSKCEDILLTFPWKKHIV
jgi:hypothetical protein